VSWSTSKATLTSFVEHLVEVRADLLRAAAHVAVHRGEDDVRIDVGDDGVQIALVQRLLHRGLELAQLVVCRGIGLLRRDRKREQQQEDEHRSLHEFTSLSNGGRSQR
jgi:hypothetical protein